MMFGRFLQMNRIKLFFMSGITLAVTLLIRLSDEELGWAGLLLVALWIGFLVYIGVNAKKTRL